MPSVHTFPYRLHRAALAPLLPDVGATELANSCEIALETGEEQFMELLLEQDLAPLWDSCIKHHGGDLSLSESFRKAMHSARLQATGSYLLQDKALALVRQVLERAKVPHAVIKGAHTREQYYDEPALRPAVDLDVLVSNQSNRPAIAALHGAGFKLQGRPNNISHECSLVKGKINVDLHWDILRPGRTRIPMAQLLLDTRRDYGTHWGPSEEASLFMLLVHPVFTKYLTTPHATLVRQLDLVYLLHKHTPDWTVICGWLNCAGLKTAAWLSLQWLEMLTGFNAPAEVMTGLQPGRTRRRYLRYWLRKNLPSRWLGLATLVQLGFTLPAHDTLPDALRAVRLAHTSRRSGSEMLAALEKELP
jgi:Uncharacterised nucleotidyltransferase